ncbi:MAG: glycerophosphodiester phosphodiesterase family protein [bacterium]
MSPTSRGHLVYNGRKVLLKYHRLLDGVHPHPPNSVVALTAILAGGAEVVEFDVNTTRDAAFVLLHDATLERETTGQGPVRAITLDAFKRLRLRHSDEPPAGLAEAVDVLRDVRRPVKVQVDVKVVEPISAEVGAALLNALAPLRSNSHLRVVIGCLADWNLRLLRRLDATVNIGLDFAYYLDAPVDELARIPMRINAYGYLDDHPLGYRRFLSTAAYLEDRVEALIDLVPGASEFYVRKELLFQTLADGFNPIQGIHSRRPGALVDVWTLYVDEPDLGRVLATVLEAGADQISSPTSALLHEFYERMSHT